MLALAIAVASLTQTDSPARVPYVIRGTNPPVYVMADASGRVWSAGAVAAVEKLVADADAAVKPPPKPDKPGCACSPCRCRAEFVGPPAPTPPPKMPAKVSSPAAATPVMPSSEPWKPRSVPGAGLPVWPR